MKRQLLRTRDGLRLQLAVLAQSEQQRHTALAVTEACSRIVEFCALNDDSLAAGDTSNVWRLPFHPVHVLPKTKLRILFAMFLSFLCFSICCLAVTEVIVHRQVTCDLC